LLLPLAVSASDLQQRYNDCMLEHLEKARTDRAVVVLSEICQYRSKQGIDESGQKGADKAAYCKLLGFDYIEETGRCAE